MNRIVKHSPKLLFVISALALSGCMTTDAMLGDKEQTPAHATDRYPITVVNGKAQSPECGNWSADLADTKENRPYDNLGCAVQHNIAAEIVNPRTIDRPAPEAQKNAEDGVGAVVRQQAYVNTTTMPGNYVYTP